MNLAIYAISKNEEHNVDRFMDACRGILVYVLDHSTDNTATMLRNRGALVDTTPITPFRFDEAKNFALDMIDKSIPWALNVDLDECLNMSANDLAFALGELRAEEPTIIRHFYKPDHEIERVRHECRLHWRDAYRWNLPIHEHLVLQPCVKEKIFALDELLLTQYPDRTRKHTWSSRLLDAVKQYPQEPRLRMLCGRDLYFDDRYEDALEQFAEFAAMERLTISNKYDLSYVYSMMAKCYNKMDRQDRALEYLQKACDYGKRRESYVDLAHGYMQRGRFEECLEWARKALKITEGQFAPHSDPGAWSFKPHELISVALYNLPARIGDAIKAAEMALSLSIGDDAKRISENLKIMRRSL